ncbi:ribosomal-protein-alanine N-acetyltransferase [compost metagenome]
MNNQYNQPAFIEQLAMHTWPAEQVQNMHHWKLRASRGITKRANSVYTTAEFPLSSDWLTEIEKFYQQQQLPTTFQISDSSPAELDQILEKAGYEKVIPCLVMSAVSEVVIPLSYEGWSRSPGDPIEVSWLPTPDEQWLQHFMYIEQFPIERKSFYEGMFPRIQPQKGFVRLSINEQTVAIGTAVAEQGWAGFLNVAIHENYRGRGIGYKLMHSLAEWSLQQNALNLYLQVMADNEPALALYHKIGFTSLYRYHYRIK